MNKNFWCLFSSQATSNVGDVLYIVSIITVLYSMYESALLLSLLPFIITIFKFICGILSPLILDKVELRRLLLFTQLTKIILFTFLSVILFDLDYNIGFIFLLVALLSIVDGLQQPISYALMPSLVAEDRLVKANSLTSISFQTSDLLTWSLGAVIVAFIGYKYSILLTLFLYIISIMLIFFIKENKHKIFDEEPQSLKLKESLLEGWNVIFGNRVLKKFLLTDSLKGFSYTVWVAAILYVYVEEFLNVGEEWWGYINTWRIFGSLIGGMIILKYSSKVKSNLIRLFFYSSLLIAVITLLFGLNSLPLISLLLVFLLGFPEQVEEIIQTTLIQESVKDIQLAKVYSAQSVVYYFIFSISVLLAGALVDYFNARFLFLISSILLFINTLIAWSIRENNRELKKGNQYEI